MERELYLHERPIRSVDDALPTPDKIIAFPDDIRAERLALETEKLEQEALRLETEAANIRRRLANGDILPRPNNSLDHEIKESQDRYEAECKAHTLQVLNDFSVDDGETLNARYSIYHDLEFSGYTEHNYVTITKKHGVYYISRHNVTSDYRPFFPSSLSANAQRLIIHEDLDSPLYAPNSTSFALKNFLDWKWAIAKYNVEFIVLTLRKDRLIKNVLRLLGEQDNPSLEISRKGRFTDYTLEQKNSDGIRLFITATYADGEKRIDPDTLSSISLSLATDGRITKSYKLDAESLEFDFSEKSETHSLDEAESLLQTYIRE